MTSAGLPETPEQRFWRWFQEHDETLFRFEEDRERVFDRLAQAMRRVHPDLTFEFGPDEEGRRDFVVSAGGIRDAFPAVHALVDAAPQLPRWRVIRFRPRRDPRVVLSLGGAEVDADGVRVAVKPEGDRLGLTLVIEGYRETREHLYEQIGYLLLDNALGEHDVETRIGTIEFVAPRHAPAGALHPLVVLPGIVDGATDG